MPTATASESRGTRSPPAGSRQGPPPRPATACLPTRTFSPAPAKTCNGVDDDCDAATADGASEPWLGQPCDGADEDQCLEGVSRCAAAAPVCDEAPESTPEVCDAAFADEDCDGLQNEDPEAGRSCPEVSFCTAGACPEGACAYGPSGQCPVTGMVRYYRDSAGHEPAQPFVPEAGVALALTGASSGAATTGADGLYDLGPRFQQVTVTPQPRLDAESSPFVTSYDALLAAKSALGWTVLTPLQRRAADVSGDGSVTFFDASLIAQYAVGLIVPVGYPDPDPAHPRPRFPTAAAAGSDWQFAPAQRSVFLSAAAPAPLNFAAILYGEVSGNRAEADTAPAAPLRLTEAAPARLEFARPAGATITLEHARPPRAARGTTTVLLTIRPAAGLQALEIGVEPTAGAAGLSAVTGRGSSPTSRPSSTPVRAGERRGSTASCRSRVTRRWSSSRSPASCPWPRCADCCASSPTRG